MDKGCLIGLAGGLGSGKSTAAQYFACQYSFEILSFGEMLTDILEKRGKEVTRENLQAMGNQLYSALGPGGLTQMLMQKVHLCKKYVIDGIRHISVYEFLKAHYDNKFILCYLEAPTIVRFQRLVSRRRFTQRLSLEEFRQKERDPTERDVHHGLKDLADFIIDSSKDNKWCYQQIDGIIKEVLF